MKDIAFRKITLEDKEVIESFLYKNSSLYLAAFTFSSLVSWEELYHYQWAITDDTLLMKLVTLDDKKEHFMMPFGAFPKALQDKMISFAQSLNYKLTFFGISREFMDNNPEFSSHFDQAEHRELDNYIYSTQDLALLKGREFQAKRNLINQFETKNNWTSEPISAENIPECFGLINNIYDQNDLNTDQFLIYELKALDFVLKHFRQLNEEGVLIRVDGKPVAFSICEPLNSSTYVVHYEKAMKEYKGLYQIVNRETAKKIMEKGYPYINREEDLGIAGLRKAKLSYHPIELYSSRALVFKGENS